MPNKQRSEPGTIAVHVLDSLHEGCQVIGFDFTYRFLNAAAVQQSRQTREQLLGHTMMERNPGIESTPMFAYLQKCMVEREHCSMENEFTFPDGSTAWFELRFVPVPEGTCILSLDITEKKRAELELARNQDQLRQAQKMEAIGRLAGGVAHDFNNMLSVILSYAGLSLQAMAEDDPVRGDIREIQRAGERAAELTRQLLTFSRQQVLRPTILDLNDSVAGIRKMLRRLIGEDIELRTVVSPSLGMIKADPGEVEQVLMNLAVNARDAMPDGGTITIETANVELDDRYAREHFGTTPGPHVMLAVSDTGAGMDAETQSKIFEPFFTTKAAGKGTGLGLSTVFGIVQRSGGSIWVYSEIGKGTTFKVYFPRATAGWDRKGPAVAVAPPERNQTILVVEDNEPLRELVVNILTRDGYEVIESATPQDALVRAASHPDAIHLLLTDVMMPVLTGPQLAERMRRTRPEMRVLFMSGFTGEVALPLGVGRGIAFVQKPITPTALTSAVRAALAQEALSGSR
jgi:two-component system, cell cycle sensor histidine kinase and response regulator CckA